MRSLISLNTQKCNTSKKGFTLVELMVSITIMLIMMGVVIFNYRSFGDGIKVNNAAYDLALSLRRAQAYAFNVKGVPCGATFCYNYGYGLHIGLSDPNSYIFYADEIDVNKKTKKYYSNGVSELLQTVSIANGVAITSIFVDGVTSINNPQFLDIEFVRPNPAAYISINNNSSHILKSSFSYVTITLGRAGKEKSVVVYSTGQVEVK